MEIGSTKFRSERRVILNTLGFSWSPIRYADGVLPPSPLAMTLDKLTEALR